MNREYKGYTITTVENGLMGCPGNPWPGSPKYFKVTRNGKTVASFSTLTRAKSFIDGPSVKTPEQAERMNALRASLAADVAKLQLKGI